MNKEQIEKAAKEAVQDHFQCNGKYPCEERDYCEFCNGHNSAFDCKEDCGADDFNEGFIAGAQWRINAVWHDASEKYEIRLPSVIVFKNGKVAIYSDLRDVTYDGLWDEVKEYAYLKDLLPERKEETK